MQDTRSMWRLKALVAGDIGRQEAQWVGGGCAQTLGSKAALEPGGACIAIQLRRKHSGYLCAKGTPAV